MLAESKLVLEPVLQNGLDRSVPAALRARIIYGITRGMMQGVDESWRSPGYSDYATFPGNGLPASGVARELGMELANKYGLLQSPLIVTTSGYSAPDSTTGPHYGKTFQEGLIRRGVHQNGDAVRTLLVQGASQDTIGEIAVLSPYLRSLCATTPELLESLQESGVTVYSSFEQQTRITLLLALTGAQAGDQSIAESSMNLLFSDLHHNPTTAYVRGNAQGIIEMANASLVNQEHAVKALALAHMGPDEVCCPKSLQQASDALFAHPRFAPWFAQHTPNLAEDLQWMHLNGIRVQNLSAEEIMLYLQKSEHRIGKKLREYWLDHIWHVEPQNNRVVVTFIAELAGAYDLLRGYYYAQGAKATEKAVHTKMLMEEFGIMPPQPHP